MHCRKAWCQIFLGQKWLFRAILSRFCPPINCTLFRRFSLDHDYHTLHPIRWRHTTWLHSILPLSKTSGMVHSSWRLRFDVASTPILSQNCLKRIYVCFIAWKTKLIVYRYHHASQSPLTADLSCCGTSEILWKTLDFVCYLGKAAKLWSLLITDGSDAACRFMSSHLWSKSQTLASFR